MALAASCASSRLFLPSSTSSGYVVDVWLLLLLVAFSSRCSFAENQCQAKPGDHIISIPLQKAPNSFEPYCQPARIRVNDRATVTLRLTGLSPLDLCVPNSKAPAITAVTNPLESIITSLSGLKSFDFENANPGGNKSLFEDTGNLDSMYFYKPPPQFPHETEAEKKKRLEAEATAAAAKEADDKALELFRTLSHDIPSIAKGVFDKQLHWAQDKKESYQADLQNISDYLVKDYRGDNYTEFNPESDLILADVRTHIRFPPTTTPGDIHTPPSEVDVANLQAQVDSLSDVGKRLITSCTTAGQTCDPTRLQTVEQLTDSAKAILAVATDNLKILQTAQAAVVASYTSLDSAYHTFQIRVSQKRVLIQGSLLVQEIPLGPDYGATDTGSIACTNVAAPTQPTTDTINYSVLYQNIPAFTVSAGLLTTFQQKRQIGTSQALNADGTVSTVFAVTDSAKAQVFPMAFVNYRFWPPILKRWWGQPESELAITNSVSGGIGVNSNTGTNQAEFFAGDAFGFNRVYVDLGVHFGRTETLGGGFKLNTTVPTGFSGSAPIDWSYHPAFSIGFSVRLAPF